MSYENGEARYRSAVGIDFMNFNNFQRFLLSLVSYVTETTKYWFIIGPTYIGC